MQKIKSILILGLAVFVVTGLVFANSGIVEASNQYVEDIAGDSHGEVFGEPELVEGVINNSLEFNMNDSEDYVELIESIPVIADELTVEVWFKVYEFGDYDTILYFRDRNSFALRIQDNWEANFWSYGLYRAAFVEEAEWAHLAGVYDNGSLTIYLNGEERFFRSEVDHGPDEYQPEGFARRVDREDRHFNGRIDEVRIWQEARSQDEIQQAMEQELTGEETNLVNYWNFNELVSEDDLDL